MGYQYVIEISEDLDLESIRGYPAWLDCGDKGFAVIDIHKIEDSAHFPR